MIGPLLTPLLTAIYALVGVGVAAYWYEGQHGNIVYGALVLGALSFVTWLLARHWVTRKPRTAVRLYELLGLSLSLVSAVVGGVAVVLGITITGIAGTEEPRKTLITSLSAALTALLTGVFVSVKELDDTVGKLVAKQFKSRYWQPAGLDDAQVEEKRSRHPDLIEVPNLSPAITAVEAEWDSGWTDWSRETRRKRAEVLSKYLAWVGNDLERRGRWADTWEEAEPGLGQQPARLAPEGWYHDPTAAFSYRWWDGRAWTGNTSQTADVDAP